MAKLELQLFWVAYREAMFHKSYAAAAGWRVTIRKTIKLLRKGVI